MKKLVSEVVGECVVDNVGKNEERTALEDVFRFDSEIAEDEESAEKEIKVEITSKSLSMDDLKDALKDDTDSEAEGGCYF